MKRHTEIYCEYFGYDIEDFIPCEICGKKAVDTNHIIPRGAGGDPTGERDVIENLMAMCRKHHDQLGDKVQYVEYLQKIHLDFMKIKDS